MRKRIRALRKYFWRRLPDGPYLFLINAKCKLKGKAHRVRAAGKGLFRVEDKHGETIYIAHRARHTRYFKGVMAQADQLAETYCLDTIDLSAAGVVVDCGANVGEIGIWAKKRGLEYHAFEPEPREAACCDLNSYDGQPRTNRMGLWYESGELTLYSKGGSADSSLIPIEKYDTVLVVPTKTLDEYVAEQDIAAIDVLKVEAEGAEPEVLQGAQEALKITRYVAADCGGERGVEGQYTVLDICNHLYSLGFTMVASNMDRYILLFENQELNRSGLKHPGVSSGDARKAA